MQTISNIPADFHLTRHFSAIYSQYSEPAECWPAEVDAPFEIRRLLGTLHRRAGLPAPGGRCVDWELPEVDCTGRKMVVGFSGGKDGLATALLARDKGLEPTLFFLEGLNRSVPSERRCAEAVAEAAGLPLVEWNLKVTGTKATPDHPLKNLLILCAMMDYGAGMGAAWYGLGCAFDENTDHENLEYDMSDSQDLIYPLMRFAQRKGYCAGFKTWLFTTGHSYHVIYRHNPALLELVSTCVTPDYRKPNIYRANVRRYGEGLILQNRCGTCYKCAEEYVQRVRLGLVRCNQDYYIKSIRGRDAFKKNYIPDFPLDKGTNTWGGANHAGVQVLSDRVGYFIGRLQLDGGLHKWFPDRFYGRRHWLDRAQAEAVLRRFVSLYKLETNESPSGA